MSESAERRKLGLIGDFWLVRCDTVVLAFPLDFAQAFVDSIRAERARSGRRVSMCEPCTAAWRDGVYRRFPRPARWRVFVDVYDDPVAMCDECSDGEKHAISRVRLDLANEGAN